MNEDYDDDYEEDNYEENFDFEDPYGNSALRKETPENPRNLPCPSCGKENRLTPKDVALHSSCNQCADRTEWGF